MVNEWHCHLVLRHQRAFHSPNCRILIVLHQLQSKQNIHWNTFKEDFSLASQNLLLKQAFQKSPFLERIKKRRLLWFGHVKQMEGQRLPIAALHGHEDGRMEREAEGGKGRYGWTMSEKT